MNFEAWLPIFVVGGVATGVALWHMATHDVPFMPKWGWALLVIVTFPVGSLVYIAVVIFGAGTHRGDAEGRFTDH